jgi:hypothetical protein
MFFLQFLHVFVQQSLTGLVKGNKWKALLASKQADCTSGWLSNSFIGSFPLQRWNMKNLPLTAVLKHWATSSIAWVCIHI